MFAKKAGTLKRKAEKQARRRRGQRARINSMEQMPLFQKRNREEAILRRKAKVEKRRAMRAKKLNQAKEKKSYAHCF